MSVRNTTKTLLMTFGAALALSACGNGADRVASPGEGAFPPAPTPAPNPSPNPPPPPPPSGGAAASCPTGFDDGGVFANGSLRSCLLPPKIATSLTVPRVSGVAYAIRGRVDVGDDLGGDANNPRAGAQSGTLIIEPGVTLFGSSGADYLVVNRGSKIRAEGSSTQPIVFTARQSLEGEAGPDSIGLWGGMVVLGRAPINACPENTQPGTPECQTQVEGASVSFYGGNAPDDDSGILRYVRVQYSGFAISNNNELNGITLAGVGRQTTVDHVQVHNSSDDGIEIFGGTVNARYIVLTGNDDDSLDTDTGWDGAIQFGIVVQRSGGGDRMNEFSSNSNAQPFSQPKIANFTFVGRAGGGAAIVLNTGSQGHYYNIVATRPAGGSDAGQRCFDIADANTTGRFYSAFFSCPVAFGNNRAQQEFAASGDANNVAQGTSTLQNTFVNGANESAVQAYQGLQSANGFFQQVNYIGGVRDASDTWWQGWTCGLTADSSC